MSSQEADGAPDIAEAIDASHPRVAGQLLMPAGPGPLLLRISLPPGAPS